MKKFYNSYILITLVIVTTLFFALAGYFYNQKLPNSWYFKYSISLTDSSKIQIGAMNNLFGQFPLLNDNVDLKKFIDEKIHLQDIPEKNPYFENLTINTAEMTFTKRSSLNDLDENLKKLLKNINTNLQNEIFGYLNSIENANNDLMILSKDLKMQDLLFSIKFYKETGTGVHYSDEAARLVQYLESRPGNSPQEIIIFDKLLQILTDVRNINSIKFLELELEKLKEQGSREMIQSKKITSLSNKIINSEII